MLFSENIIFSAPTGRASRRLAESVGTDAATIHSTLGLREDSEEANNPIDSDLMVVDEMSMVDMSLAHMLFKNLSLNTKLLRDIWRLHWRDNIHR